MQEPGPHIADVRLGDLLDLGAIQRMADAHYLAAGMPIGIIDASDGSILVGAGWQRICVAYHRANPVSLQRCRQSDDYIKSRLVQGEAVPYKCKNGLWDIGVPIMVAGRHLATVFLGQFFYESKAPRRGFFVRQALELGFDADHYLAALDEVPVFSREIVAQTIAYNVAFVTFLSELAEGSLTRIHAEREIQRLNADLERRVAERTVQRLVQRHGGRVWAESVPGKGATFYFTLAP